MGLVELGAVGAGSFGWDAIKGDPLQRKIRSKSLELISPFNAKFCRNFQDKNQWSQPLRLGEAT